MLHGYIPPHRFLHYLSWPQVARLPDRANTVIVLPVGSIEQHGPHLPCAVDTLIAAGVVGKALERLPASVPAFGMAPICYGKSDEHIHFPGTVTIDGDTLLRTVIDVGESVYRSGFRKLLIVNGHGGQPQVMDMAAREMRVRHGDFVIIRTSRGASRMWRASFFREGKRPPCMRATRKPRLSWRWRPTRCTCRTRRGVSSPNFRRRRCPPTAVPPAPGPRATSDPPA
jgi:creatinine amidohydrolase